MKAVNMAYILLMSPLLRRPISVRLARGKVMLTDLNSGQPRA
jgi:hypothetical protein